MHHRVPLTGEHAWQSSLNADGKPTLSPSLLLRGEPLCHTYVHDGQIQYLTDCTHSFAGKTIDLPHYPQ